jgi:hypothetical protein
MKGRREKALRGTRRHQWRDGERRGGLAHIIRKVAPFQKKNLIFIATGSIERLNKGVDIKVRNNASLVRDDAKDQQQQ